MNKKRVLSFFVAFAFSVLSFGAYAASININKASAEEIADNLNGIGQVKAEAIVDYCKSNTCSSVDDLLNIKGIGEKTLEKIAGDVRFSDQ